MQVWTIQPPEVWESLNRDGYYSADTEKVLANRILAPEVPLEEDYTIAAYRWISKQMVARIGFPPAGVEFPIWAWYKWSNNSKRCRPDLRCSGYGPKGRELVLIGLNLDDNEVLLSDFDLWWFGYSSVYLPRGGAADERAFEKMLKTEGIDPYRTKTLPPHLQKIKEKSWETVFDQSYRSRYLQAGSWKNRCIQATFWRMKKEQVTEYRPFRSR